MIVCGILAVKVPGLIASGRIIASGGGFLIFCRSGDRRHNVHWRSIGGVHRAAVLLAAHHVAEREENSAQQHDTEKQSYQMPAFQYPVATSASASAA